MRSMNAMVLAVLASTAAVAAEAHMMAAIDEAGNLVRFSDRQPQATESFSISGTSARIVGIDARRKDNELYGLASDGTIYRIDTSNGNATLKTRLNRRFDQVGAVDFDPDDDRLYVIAADGRTSRINVDTGEVVDLAAPGAMFGQSRRITAGGFTNDQFFCIDSGQMVLFQQPASARMHNATLRREISLGGSTDDIRGGDVYTDPTGNQSIYVVRGARLFKIDVRSGQIMSLGQVGADERLKLIDVAVTRAE